MVKRVKLSNPSSLPQIHPLLNQQGNTSINYEALRIPSFIPQLCLESKRTEGCYNHSTRKAFCSFYNSNIKITGQPPKCYKLCKLNQLLLNSQFCVFVSNVQGKEFRRGVEILCQLTTRGQQSIHTIQTVSVTSSQYSLQLRKVGLYGLHKGQVFKETHGHLANSGYAPFTHIAMQFYKVYSKFLWLHPYAQVN